MLGRYGTMRGRYGDATGTLKERYGYAPGTLRGLYGDGMGTLQGRDGAEKLAGGPQVGRSDSPSSTGQGMGRQQQSVANRSGGSISRK